MNVHKRGAELGLTGMQFISEFPHKETHWGAMCGGNQKTYFGSYFCRQQTVCYMLTWSLARAVEFIRPSLQVPCGPLQNPEVLILHLKTRLPPLNAFQGETLSSWIIIKMSLRASAGGIDQGPLLEAGWHLAEECVITHWTARLQGNDHHSDSSCSEIPNPLTWSPHFSTHSDWTHPGILCSKLSVSLQLPESS